MSVEENKAAFQRVIDEIFNKGDLSVIPALIAPGYIMNSPAGKIEGQEGFKQYIITARTAFPDLKLTIDEMVGEGDKLAAQIVVTGTFKGKYIDFEPTGNQVNTKQSVFHRFKNGKQVEVTAYADQLTLFQQMGVTFLKVKSTKT